MLDGIIQYVLPGQENFIFDYATPIDMQQLRQSMHFIISMLKFAFYITPWLRQIQCIP